MFVEGGRRGSGVPLNYSMTGVLLPLQAVLQNNQKQRLFSWIAVNTYHKPHKTPKKLKKPLQNAIKQCILINAVTLIALKLEVAARWKHIAGFQWSECHVRKLAASHCTIEFKGYFCVICLRGQKQTHPDKCTVTTCCAGLGRPGDMPE